MLSSESRQSYHLILVEDSRREYEALRLELEADGWQVQRAVDVDDAPYQLELAEKQGVPIDAMAVDLGLPPDREDPEKSGLPLIEKIRGEQKSLPILAYTTMPPRQFSVEKVARSLLTLRVSFAFIKYSGEIDSFTRLLDLTRLGYVILSPDVVNQLPYSIANRPDPLDEDHWNVLRFLGQGYIYEEIANELYISRATVTNRLEKIRELLQKADPIGEFFDNDDLINWYNANKVRYCRE